MARRALHQEAAVNRSDSERLKELLPTETALCAQFIAEFNELPDWTCYPETGGFDVLVAHDDGRQIGVEAKLQLNAKVAEQIIPADHFHRYARDGGPDHRLVIVRNITEASAGIERLLHMMGVEVWAPHLRWDYRRGAEKYHAAFEPAERLRLDSIVARPPLPTGHWHPGLFDWNPASRVTLPDVVPSVPAGVPCPVRMTPWKQAAVRVVARMRVQGHITAKEIAEEGCSPSMWTQRWLDRGPSRGEWVETPRLPAFDKQHPELYAVALTRARAADEERRRG